LPPPTLPRKRRRGLPRTWLRGRAGECCRRRRSTRRTSTTLGAGHEVPLGEERARTPQLIVVDAGTRDEGPETALIVTGSLIERLSPRSRR